MASPAPGIRRSIARSVRYPTSSVTVPSLSRNTALFISNWHRAWRMVHGVLRIVHGVEPSALCPTPFALCPLPSALRPLPSALCPLLFAQYHLLPLLGLNDLEFDPERPDTFRIQGL